MPSLTCTDNSKKDILITPAAMAHVPALLALNHKWLKTNLTDYSNGYVGAALSEATFTELVKRQQVLAAFDAHALAGYYLLNDFSKEGVIGRHADIVAGLKASGVIDSGRMIGIGGQGIVDTPYMGSGLAQLLLDALCLQLAGKFDYLFGTIAKDNPRSLKAHTRMGCRVIGQEESLYYVLYPIQ